MESPPKSTNNDDGALPVIPLESETIKDDPIPQVIPLEGNEITGNAPKASRSRRRNVVTPVDNRVATRSSRRNDSNSIDKRSETPPVGEPRRSNSVTRSVLKEETRSLVKPVKTPLVEPLEPDYHQENEKVVI